MNHSLLWLAGACALTLGAAQAQPTSYSMTTPPLAPIKPKQLTSPFGTRTDNYYWLNERENPEVLSYLNAENAYFDKQMAPAKELEDKLFNEIKGRIKEQDESERLSKEIEYARGFLESVMKKLSNEKFVQNAKPDVLERERQKQADAEGKIVALEQSLAAL